MMNKDWSYLQAPTKKQKEFIARRDNHQCQYCGHSVKMYPIYEHVVPRKLDGPTEDFNIVLSCFSCNKTKGSNVWIPHNFDEITVGMVEWREIVFEMSEQFFPNKRQKIKSKQPKFLTLAEWDKILSDAIAKVCEEKRASTAGTMTGQRSS